MASTRPSFVTQREVARRAGVSRRTVSNVVNGFPLVSEQTRARVQRVIDELGYQPNNAARNLRSGRTGMIALVLPLNVPYFAELTEYVVEEARQRSYVVIIDRTDGDPVRERELIVRSDNASLFDGMIFSPAGLGETELVRRRPTSPVVLLGQRIPGGPFDHVMIDNVAAARAATEHLLGIGRRRIALIGRQGERTTDIAYDRADGYRRALRDAGLQVDPELEVVAAGFRRESGARAMTELLGMRTPPDAVFCYNDPLALGAIRTIRERGLRVPEDIAVVGFDDSEDGQYALPSLTTISQDKEQIARYAVELLVARLEGDTGEPVTRYADWRLVCRESTLGYEGETPRPEPADDVKRSKR